MKTTLTLGISLILVSINLVAFGQTGKTSEKPVATHADSIVPAQNFIFVADQAIPMRGRVWNLTSEYTLRVTKDTIEANLPYFGRAYTAPIDPKESGITFISKDFEYVKKISKKRSYEITIKPKDVNGGYQLFLTIFSNGYGNLNVTCTNREPISFYGRLK